MLVVVVPVDHRPLRMIRRPGAGCGVARRADAGILEGGADRTGRCGPVDGRVDADDRFHVDVHGGDDLKVHGNIVDHEYEIERDGDTVARISKKWFRVRDTYGVEIDPGDDVVLMLAVTVAVDALAHD